MANIREQQRHLNGSVAEIASGPLRILKRREILAMTYLCHCERSEAISRITWPAAFTMTGHFSAFTFGGEHEEN